MKKIIALVLVIALSLSIFTCNASAFGGYAHYTMGAFVAIESGLSEQAQLAYTSGCLLADIGNTTWDSKLRKWFKENNYPSEYYTKNSSTEEYNKKYFASDEYLFTKAMYDVSNSIDGLSSSAKIMAYGWRDHYIQDQYGSIADIESRPIGAYPTWCGWIDEYLRDESGLSGYPIQNNALDEIYISYELIRKTYESITNGYLSPSNDDIKEEIKDMFALYDLAILANFFGWSETQIDEINKVLISTMDLCPGPFAADPANYEDDKHLKIKTSIFLSPRSNSSSSKLMSNTMEEDATVFENLSSRDLKDLTKYMEVKETPISDSEAYISISITDRNAYRYNLNKICSEKLSAVSNNLA